MSFAYHHDEFGHPDESGEGFRTLGRTLRPRTFEELGELIDSGVEPLEPLTDEEVDAMYAEFKCKIVRFHFHECGHPCGGYVCEGELDHCISCQLKAWR
jgi:hypothetical protein